MLSFADPETHFRIVESDTPVSVDGFAKGEPTGEIECLECGAVHVNIDDIPHDAECPNRFAHSRWYAGAMMSE
ncbi:hypothetical protein U3A55_12025 [Salarchaeum sp. III]|uniref:hypothetical protein n=1 Tax=Salarchaeum sp. III TaxID=3107927 RepID=UPI002ED78E3B